MIVIGVDPGPLPGIAVLLLHPAEEGHPAHIVQADAAQVTEGLLTFMLDGIFTEYGTECLAVEQFVVGNRAARSRTPAAGVTTRHMIGWLTAWADQHTTSRRSTRPVRRVLRTASDVKPWATDRRLEAAGLLALTEGMRHARDAARHGLFCAVKDYGLPDPLSRSAGAR